MYAKPKLSLVISTAQTLTRPSLSLKSPAALPRTPISPVPSSPAGKRFSSMQMQPPQAYSYTNSCASKSILKKQQHKQSQSQSQTLAGAASSREKRIQFQGSPTVHCVTPIENPEEYYGTYTKLTREERRWMVRE
ncbi:uncharacterized protein ACLA_006900 [Aspergillus clavatus NRRL 1]|uniref:Uncharacterized protein n=1 Tax=Aspergillus clavatus (strain ATCC 1007 / CBS 513.65 / DSM 816 / NCTC 3887 / NRRL 1 / QM 1276 / 107) TaxID=344612 RepID=A1CDK4_ASPCL|nr:uncharacterized protein ACLA_006900 [Aspergillus clavatus NRRL 1]EAW11931.1 conserved hypothetical protein [Aspergillus clavatus NRRL 1]